MKLLADNIRKNLDDISYGDAILDATPKTRSMKKKIDKLDFIKVNTFCFAKDNNKRIERWDTGVEKIFNQWKDHVHKPQSQHLWSLR